MEFYIYENNSQFVYCVENPEGRVYEKLKDDPFWTKTEPNKFIKSYPLDTNWDDAWYLDKKYKEIIINNFSKHGKAWIEQVFDWKSVLLFLAKIFKENQIEYWITGSVSEALLGLNIIPNDIDIVVHTKDFYKVKDLTFNYAIEPLGDNKGAWIIRYFGKLIIDGASVDIASDEKMNVENLKIPYEKISWEGYDLCITSLKSRYEIELMRKRADRIKIIEEYLDSKQMKDINK